MCVLSRFSHVRLLSTPWTAALQAPLSLEFSRQEGWSGPPCPPPGDLPDPGPHKAPPNGFSSSSNFLRALHTVFRSCCPVLKSCQQCTKLLVSLLSHQYLLFSDFIFIFNLSVSGLLLWGVGFSPVVAPGRQSKPELDCCSLWGELPYSMCDLNSSTRDRTWVPCAGRQILNHWTTRVSFFFSPHTTGCRGIFQCGFIYISLIVRLSIVLGAYWSFVYNLEKCLSKSFPCFVIELLDFR